MLYKTSGIVLRVIRYSDTSIIAKIYTRALGLQSYIVKGVRSEKHKSKAVLFQPGNILQMDVYKRPHKELNYIREYKMIHCLPSVRLDILKGAVMLFLLEILNKTLKEEHANEAIFDFIEAALIDLDAADTLNLNFHLQFLIDLSGYLGFRPSGQYNIEKCCFDLEEGIFVHAHHNSKYLMPEPYSQWLFLMLNGKQPAGINNVFRAKFLEYLLTFYQLHLHEFGTIHAHRILHEILHA
jgi:DNA repair protein RecO (recombination protein O)